MYAPLMLGAIGRRASASGAQQEAVIDDTDLSGAARSLTGWSPFPPIFLMEPAALIYCSALL